MPGGWSTNWSSHPYGVPEFDKNHAVLSNDSMKTLSRTIKASDTLQNQRLEKYDATNQRSKIPDNHLSAWSLDLRPATAKFKKPKFKPPKLKRVRLPHEVIEFNRRLRLAALDAAGHTGNIKLGLLRLFVQNDEDGDGTITENELMKFCNKLGMNLHRDQLKKIFHFFDDDGGGVLTCHEIIDEVVAEVREVATSHGSVSTARSTISSVSTKSSSIMGPIKRKYKKDLQELVELDKKKKPPCVRRFQKRLLEVARQRGGGGPDVDMRPNITQIFREIDSDGSYTLTEDEMIDFIKNKLNLRMSFTNITDVCRYYDSDGGGAISYKELIEAVLEGTPPPSYTSDLLTNRSAMSTSRREAFDYSLSMPNLRAERRKRAEMLNTRKQLTKHGSAAEFIDTLQRLNKNVGSMNAGKQQLAMDSLRQLCESVKAKKATAKNKKNT